MEAISNFIGEINGLVWGPPMLVMILGVGLFLSIGLKLMPILKLGAGFRLMWNGRARGDDAEGEIPPFQALM
ncbi:MAG TPA: sodium:alanine symporter family protein, partial [Marinobacter sp.]|nr:sodium:alanine symporter family protein [Marinobacter sp.]